MSDSKTIRLETIDVDMSKLSPKAKQLVGFGAYLGWTTRNTRGGGVVLTSPTGQTIAVPATTNINVNRLHGWMDKVLRYGDPMRKAAFEMFGPEMNRAAERGELVEWLFEHTLKNPEMFKLLEGVAPEVRPIVEEHAIPREQLPEELRGPDPEPEPTVLSERPWLAKRGSGDAGGRVYPSRTTIERRWSNGGMDYRCAKDGCDYSDPIPQKVASHYRASKDHPNVDQPRQAEMLRTEPWDPAKRRDPQGRINRLARELADMLDALADEGAKFTSYDNTDRLAHDLAVKVIEKRDRERRMEDEPAEPLTAEQLVEKIRQLVDDGSYYNAIIRERELSDELAVAKLQAEQCATQAASALAAKHRLENDLAGVRDLLASIGTETPK